MRRRVLPILGVIAVSLATSLWVSQAHAQSCCAASQTAGPVRLSMGHMGAVGVAADARRYTGRFVDGQYRSIEYPGYEFRQNFFGAYRLGESWQVGATVAVVENRRSTATETEWGGGLGDAGLQARYEIMPTGFSMRWPGIGVTAAATFPTGRSPAQSIERGQSRLMTDVTGPGEWSLGTGLQLEWVFGASFLALEAGVNAALPYTDARGLDVQPNLRWNGRISVGRPIHSSFFWDESLYLAASLQVNHDGGKRIDGQRAPSSVERATSLSLQAGGYITERTLLMVQTAWDLPVDYLGMNRQVGPSVGLVLRRVFYDDW